MIRGEVTSDLEAVIEVVVRGPSGTQARVQGQIDTGFNDSLTLPGDAIAALGLPYEYTITMFMANNTESEMNLYSAEVIWDGHPRSIYIHESESMPLVGMALLEGYSLYIEAMDGGEVGLTPLIP